jgi:hypothetical protein
VQCFELINQRSAFHLPYPGIKEKRRTIVEYALRDAAKLIGVVAYRIVKRLAKELKEQLPSPEQIEKLLGDIRSCLSRKQPLMRLWRTQSRMKRFFGIFMICA